MKAELRNTPGIYLVGFMGCGKTSVGRALAEQLGWRFVNVNEDIEAKAGITISEILETQGETAFRTLEAEAILARVREVQRGRAAVIALGEGAFARDGNRDVLDGNGVSIWLDASLDVLRERAAMESPRPLARDPERFAQLYEKRRETYAKSMYRVDASGTGPEVVVQRILDLPVF